MAKKLLGCILVHIVNGKRRSGFITETEAYIGIEDRACHAFGGKKTERLKSLYLPAGHSYVYLIYGLHYCLNVVSEKEGDPQAVLLRALYPFEGIKEMQRARGGKHKPLATGPGMLCEAMGISKKHDRIYLLSNHFYLEKSPIRLTDKDIVAKPRIGVDYAKEAALWPLNFSIHPRALERLKTRFPST